MLNYKNRSHTLATSNPDLRSSVDTLLAIAQISNWLNNWTPIDIITFHLLNLITWHCGIDINKQVKILDFHNAVESISTKTKWNIIHVK